MEVAVETSDELARRASRLDDPDLGLAAVAALRRRLEVLEAAQVEHAVRSGWRWTRIAGALGVSKQAVHQKHAARLRAPAVGADERRAQLVVSGHARRAVRHGREEAAQLGHREVGTEHLLLGLLRDDAGSALRALRSLGVTLEEARNAVERIRANETPSVAVSAVARTVSGATPISPRARAVLEGSMREAIALGGRRLDVEHLLLALVREPDGAAVETLGVLGASAPAVLRAVTRVMGDEGVSRRRSDEAR